jgi:cystathionine gamma-synthase
MEGFDTKLIHGHGYYDEDRGYFIPPIYMGTICEHPDRETGQPRMTERGTELKYAREENVTVEALESAIARIEDAADALGYASGMGAISSLLISILRPGMRVVVPMEEYGTTIRLLEELRKFGVTVDQVWPDTEHVIDALSKPADIVFLETMTNPTLRVLDVRQISRAARDAGAKLIVDNTFVTPYLYRPLTDGAYAVVHSATKYLAGHNDVLAGVSAFPDQESARAAWEWRRMLGSTMSAFSAYLVLRGLKSLSIRMERESASAMAIAEFLREHPAVKVVHYPGLSDSPYREVADRLFERRLYGAVVSFELKGGKESVLRALKRVRVIKPSPSLGGTESLLTYAAMSASGPIAPEVRERLGITDGLLRLSVGLEDVDDLIEDLDAALRGRRVGSDRRPAPHGGVATRRGPSPRGPRTAAPPAPRAIPLCTPRLSPPRAPPPRTCSPRRS